MAVANGNWISVSYKGTLKDGTVFDSSEGREPLTFEVGAGTVIKGFDDNVKGMNVGQEKEFKIPCKDAYGEETDEHQEDVPVDFFKGVEKVEPGMVFVAQSPMGPLKVKVLTMDETKAKVSVNHPLAGEDLTFKIKVEKVLNEAEAKKHKEELEKMMKAHSCSHDGCSDCDHCQ